MQIEKVSLFTSRRDFFFFLTLALFIFAYAILMEYNDYKRLTQFDSYVLDAKVLKEYSKTKTTKKGKLKSYQVLKLKGVNGVSFYTTYWKKPQNFKGKTLLLEIFTEELGFYEYLTTFYASSKILKVDENLSLKQTLNERIETSHENGDVASLYKALYTASPLPQNLQIAFSTYGVSHLLAISGFHLGVLSALLFFLLKIPYKFFQDRYFPYRNSKRDIFIVVALTLLAYLLFLESPASLLRAYAMLIIGFVLYDRGVKIVSMQTLLLTLILLLAFFPRLFFALGFWLSIAGVFYIFLFLLHFKRLSKLWQFLLVPLWVYLLMLPLSLAIFGNFSLHHPLSIIWTSLFTLFYPLSLFLHLMGMGNLLDGILEAFTVASQTFITLKLDYLYLGFHILLSFLSVYKRGFVPLLVLYSLAIFAYFYYFALNPTNLASSSLSLTT